MIPHTVEITKPAALLLMGNPETTWNDFTESKDAEISTYRSHGLFIYVIHNFNDKTTRYYIKDINF